ncbi:ROK family transcriptional regulator [Glaciihabitans sp. dw_435]|uniref:ROK family transcriptional regulator n=1 Tax=Glaciihabitans sp. dw_435 TaxID=2720081 RepID=UPI001BD3B803|nr:ROK family transcriptional regulator [Glaciihabitans sp. dw_435]
MAQGRNEGKGNSNDSVRRHNLSVLLRLVHGNDGISRSQLTRQTGLNRSTIAALVGELVERELVVEVDPDSRNQVGRPSPIVRPGPRAVGIAINPEIDAITVGIVGLGGTVLRRIRHNVDHVPTAEEAVAISAQIIDGLREEFDLAHRAVGIGVAVPGLVRSHDGLVRLAPHLGWVDEPLSEMLEEATGFSVVAANDARLGTLAESTFGAGRGLTDLIYLNGGASGIGGGAIVNGSPLRGVSGYAGELGHTLVNSSGVVCHCGAVGCLETEVRRSTLLQLTGVDVEDADDLEAAMLESSSAEVTEEIDRQVDTLAITLRNAINTLNPQLIVLGGFLGSLYAVNPGRLERGATDQSLPAARDSVRIARAELGKNLLIIGAAELAFESILADPSSF